MKFKWKKDWWKVLLVWLAVGVLINYLRPMPGISPVSQLFLVVMWPIRVLQYNPPTEICVTDVNYYCDTYFDTALQQTVYRFNRQLVLTGWPHVRVDATIGMLSSIDCDNLVLNPELANFPAIQENFC